METPKESWRGNTGADPKDVSKEPNMFSEVPLNRLEDDEAEEEEEKEGVVVVGEGVEVGCGVAEMGAEEVAGVLDVDSGPKGEPK